MTTATSSTHSTTPRGRQFTGRVTAAGNDKTIAVRVERTLRHALYGKSFKKSRTFQVHDPENRYAVDDVVTFVECRPLSKTKRWTVIYN